MGGRAMAAAETASCGEAVGRVGPGADGRPRVLIACDHYLPGVNAGGPIRSLSAIVSRLGGDFDFCIATRDRDLGAAEPFPGIRADVWGRCGDTPVYYAGGGQPTLRAWAAIARETRPDAIYLNSFFSQRYSQALLLLRRMGRLPGVRIVLAPRGELHPGALAIRSWKKLPFLRLARRSGMVDGVVWHATAEEEAEQIRTWFGADAEVVVAPVLSAASAAEPAPALRQKRRGALDVAFLSRISVKKNLRGAIEMLAGVPGEVRLNVYGPKEDARYWADCQAAIAALPGNVTVVDRGAVGGDRVRWALAENHAFLFPTFGENFGHVILEALLAGLPVVISDQTPWRDLEARRAGFDLPLARPDLFRRRLTELAEMDDGELSAWSRGAHELGLAYARDDAAAVCMRALLAGGGGR